MSLLPPVNSQPSISMEEEPKEGKRNLQGLPLAAVHSPLQLTNSVFLRGACIVGGGGMSLQSPSYSIIVSGLSSTELCLLKTKPQMYINEGASV